MSLRWKREADELERAAEPVAPESATTEEAESLWNREITPCGSGIILLVIGVVFAIWQIAMPWYSAFSGAAEVTFNEQAVFLVPLLVALGGLYTFATDWTVAVLGHPQRPGPWSLPVALLLSLVGFLLMFWFEAHLESYGYVFEDPFGPSE